VSTGKKKPQVPPLRFAPVGMTILLCPQELQREILDPRDRIVSPTGVSMGLRPTYEDENGADEC
jgi:hypothetical protein